MKRCLITGLIISQIALALLGCATTSPQPPVLFTVAEPKSEKPDFIQVPVVKPAYQLMYGNDPALSKAFNQYVATGKAPNIVTDGFIKYAYYASQQPIVKTTPLQETVISLEPGEHFTNISSGDPNRWSYSVAASGSGMNIQQNVLVKPSPPDQASMNMATNLVIATTKRIYNIRLVCSANGELTRNVSFWYPEEMVDSLNEARIKKTNDATTVSNLSVDLNNLNFNYSIASQGLFSSEPAWKPIRVFDDGSHTYIQFPIGVTNRDMPVLFVSQGNTKSWLIITPKPPYFVVDRLFKQAVLVTGVGATQLQVRLINNRY